MERRISAIMVADMVGYSRLMEIDEIGTIERQKAHRKELIDPTLEKFRGRIVKTTGDGLLAEFSSVVDAVQCAVAIQRAMADREADVAEDQRIQYRIGINLGDVVAEDDDLYGDGVNVAARLEQLAEPGGICISGTAYDHLRSNVEVGYEALGEVQVKNIERPIRAYKVLTDPRQAGEVIDEGQVPVSRQTWKVVAAAAVLLIAITGVGAWLWLQQPDFEPADPAKYAFELPENPSIAILPFDNLSGDASQDYIVDGLTENIIAVLSTLPKLFVIARNSSFTYKGKATKVQTIAEQLGVRYVLEGSVQRSGDMLRVTAQLVDALNGRHIWADRYDRNIDDWFKIQDEITGEILAQLDTKLVSGETAQSILDDVGDLENYRLLAEAVTHLQSWEPERHLKAEKLYLEGLRRKPDSAQFNTGLAWIYWSRMSTSPPDKLKQVSADGRRFAEAALKGDPNSAGAYMVLAWMELYLRNYQKAEALAAKSLELQPGGGIMASLGGWAYSALGQPEKGVELIRLGMRTEPFYPDWVPSRLGVSLIMLGRYDEARQVFEAILRSERDISPFVRLSAHSNLAQLAVFRGDLEIAKEHVEDAQRIYPDFSILGARKTFGYIRDQAHFEKRMDALRQAGAPEKPTSRSANQSLSELLALPGVAVLPLENLSPDPEHAFFADGLTEELTSRLSRFTNIRVIARNSAARYKGKAEDVRKIGKDLGVRYVVEGSVRRAADSVRVTVQLIDGKNGNHLWASSYDETLSAKSLFQIQDDIASKVASAIGGLGGAVRKASELPPKAMRPDDMQAYDCTILYFRFFDTFDSELHARARDCYEAAVRRHPGFALGWGHLSYLYGMEYAHGFNRKPDPLKRALEAGERAIEEDPNTDEGYGALAQTFTYMHKEDEALVALERAYENNPNNGNITGGSGCMLALLGHLDRAKFFLDRARVLSPHPGSWVYYCDAARLFQLGEMEAALEVLTAYSGPENYWIPVLKAICLVELGRTDEAEEALKKAIALHPSIEHEAVQLYRFMFWAQPEVGEKMISALHAAGLPKPQQKADQ